MIPPPAIPAPTPMPMLAERLGVALNQFIQDLRVQQVRVVMNLALLMRIQRYFRRLTARFARLVALAQAGQLPPPRAPRRTGAAPQADAARTAPAPASSPSPAREVIALPRAFAWLFHVARSQQEHFLVNPAAGTRALVEDLLNHPELIALAAQAPRLERVLRPLRQMLGIRPPGWCPRPQPRPASLPATSPPKPTHPFAAPPPSWPARAA